MKYINATEAERALTLAREAFKDQLSLELLECIQERLDFIQRAIEQGAVAVKLDAKIKVK
ncbi:MAG: hypothetical protein WC506_07050 [Candidatus Micrarchaeia archaeon]